MQSAVCNRCPLWAKCCLTYGGKACKSAAKEAGFEVKPTNFERIKDMSIEEMARFLRHIRYDEFGTMIIEEALLFTDNDFIEWIERS